MKSYKLHASIGSVPEILNLLLRLSEAPSGLGRSAMGLMLRLEKHQKHSENIATNIISMQR